MSQKKTITDPDCYISYPVKKMSVAIEIAQKFLTTIDDLKNNLHEFIDNCEKVISISC